MSKKLLTKRQKAGKRQRWFVVCKEITDERARKQFSERDMSRGGSCAKGTEKRCEGGQARDGMDDDWLAYGQPALPHHQKAMGKNWLVNNATGRPLAPPCAGRCQLAAVSAVFAALPTTHALAPHQPLIICSHCVANSANLTIHCHNSTSSTHFT